MVFNLVSVLLLKLCFARVVVRGSGSKLEGFVVRRFGGHCSVQNCRNPSLSHDTPDEAEAAP